MNLAGDDIAHHIGSTVSLVLWPTAGLLLLVFGIRRLIAHRRWVRRENQRLLNPGAHGIGLGAQPSATTADNPDAIPLAKPSRGGAAMIIIGVIALTIGLLQLAARVIETRSEPGITVGQCISAQTYQEGSFAADPVDCELAEAPLQLVSKGDGTWTCPDGKRQGTRYLALLSESRTYCFALNATEGQCFVFARAPSPVDCTDPTANAKIALRVDDSTDGSVCGKVRAVVYPDPQRVYCIVEP